MATATRTTEPTITIQSRLLKALLALSDSQMDVLFYHDMVVEARLTARNELRDYGREADWTQESRAKLRYYRKQRRYVAGAAR